MTDNEIIKAIEEALDRAEANGSIEEFVLTLSRETVEGIIKAYNSQKAEIERLRKLQKPTEASGFKIENGKVIFYTNILNGYRHEFKDLDEVVEELNLMLRSCYTNDELVSHYKFMSKIAKSEAIKEFAERFDSMLADFADYDTLHIYEIKDRLDIVKEMEGETK